MLRFVYYMNLENSIKGDHLPKFQIKSVGNSAHIILPKNLLKVYGLEIGDYVEVPTFRKLSEAEVIESIKEGYIK